jgi:hypothetical protein
VKIFWSWQADTPGKTGRHFARISGQRRLHPQTRGPVTAVERGHVVRHMPRLPIWLYPIAVCRSQTSLVVRYTSCARGQADARAVPARRAAVRDPTELPPHRKSRFTEPARRGTRLRKIARRHARKTLPPPQSKPKPISRGTESSNRLRPDQTGPVGERSRGGSLLTPRWRGVDSNFLRKVPKADA